MLLISRAQREQAGEPAFVERVVTHFKRYHLEAIYMLPDEVLRRRIVHGLERGRAHGLTWEYSLTVFVAHMMRINPEFDKHLAILRELQNATHGTPDERIDALPAYVSREEWEEAALQCDAEAYWRAIGAGTPDGRSEP